MNMFSKCPPLPPKVTCELQRGPQAPAPSFLSLISFAHLQPPHAHSLAQRQRKIINCNRSGLISPSVGKAVVMEGAGYRGCELCVPSTSSPTITVLSLFILAN